MSQELDLPPIYDPLIKGKKDYISSFWEAYLTSLVQTIQTYLSTYGVTLPSLTTVQRNQIQHPQNGQMIYNTTMDTAQYFKVSSGLWINF